MLETSLPRHHLCVPRVETDVHRQGRQLSCEVLLREVQNQLHDDRYCLSKQRVVKSGEEDKKGKNESNLLFLNIGI